MSIDFDALPASALVREKQLRHILPFSRATFWRLVRAQRFPTPIRMNDGRITAWRVGDVREWLAAQGEKSGSR